jgi:hypothetical protein
MTNKPPSPAKHLNGVNKTDFTRQSFKKKLERMELILKTWKKSGLRGNEYWPSTLDELKEWSSPELGFYAWSTNNVTKRKGNYSDEVVIYWSLQKELAEFVDDPTDLAEQNRRLKLKNTKLEEHLAAMTWAIMDYREVILRISPEDIVLKRHKFP